MRETEGWTKEQYQTSNLKLSRQPVAANGTQLGIVAPVKLKVTVKGTDKTIQVPCTLIYHFGRVSCGTVGLYLVLIV